MLTASAADTLASELTHVLDNSVAMPVPSICKPGQYAWQAPWLKSCHTLYRVSRELTCCQCQEVWHVSRQVTHWHRKRVCWAPHARLATPAFSSSLISVGKALSLKVRVPSWPQLLLPHAHTVLSVTATVCCPPAATHRTCCMNTLAFVH